MPPPIPTLVVVYPDPRTSTSFRLDISIGELLDVIAAYAVPALPSMSFRDLANLAWSFAAQRRLDEELMLGIALEVSTCPACFRYTRSVSPLLVSLNPILF